MVRKLAAPRVRIIERTLLHRSITAALGLRQLPALAVLVPPGDHSPGTCSVEELQRMTRGTE